MYHLSWNKLANRFYNKSGSENCNVFLFLILFITVNINTGYFDFRYVDRVKDFERERRLMERAKRIARREAA